jgi:monovalent cation/proton antiporter MnhG/PhaG subunit
MSAEALADGLAALLLIAGLVFVVLSALGVLRLPDAYLRMHAATKAGMMGAGLVVLAAAAAIGGPEAWIKAILAVGFLAVTAPIASHLLGRAAYVSGAPLWHGTGRDALADVLDRVSGPPEDAPRSWPEPRPAAEDHMTEIPIRPPVPAEPAETAATALKTLTVALLSRTDSAAATRVAIDLAVRHGAAVTTVTHVDVRRLSNVGPVPIGGLWYAERLRASRIAQARGATERALGAFEAAALEAGVPYRARHCEERLDGLLAELSMTSDLIVFGDEALPGAELPPAPHLPDVLHAPVLVARAPLPRIRRCVMTAPCGPAFSRFVASGLLRGATLCLLGQPGTAARDRIGDLAAHAGRTGIAVEILPVAGEPDWRKALRLDPDLLVVPIEGSLRTRLRTPGWRERTCPGWDGPVVFA